MYIKFVRVDPEIQRILVKTVTSMMDVNITPKLTSTTSTMAFLRYAPLNIIEKNRVIEKSYLPWPLCMAVTR